ncbi:SDR family NAD(P)-dependent oxidoreductase, partial [Nocardia salmonicida]
MMFDPLGRSVVVTGGARGIGAAVARALVESGAGGVVDDLLEREGDSTATALGLQALFRHLDVTDENEWARVLDDAEATFGLWQSEPPAQLRHFLDVNLVSAWLGMHLAAPRLRAAGDGVIMNVSSTAGLIGYSGIAGYAAGKWGLRGLTKAAALELGRRGSACLLDASGTDPDPDDQKDRNMN